MSSNKSQPAKVFLLTWARTASHLTERILSGQPDTELLSHPYRKARLTGLNKYFLKLSDGVVAEDDRKSLQAAFQECYADLMKRMDAINAEGKRALVHEHVSWILDPDIAAQWLSPSSTGAAPGLLSNSPSESWTPVAPDPTISTFRSGPFILPDAVIARHAIAIFPIRHPALAFPSMFRMTTQIGSMAPPRSHFKFILTFAPMRLVYEWLMKYGEYKPIVVDVGDITAADLAQRDAAMKELCARVGFDPNALQYQWSATTDAERKTIPPMAARMLNTLLSSTGVVSTKKSARELDLDEEARKWAEEFGEEDAVFIKDHVLTSMADYEFLLERRVGVASP